MSTPLRVVGWSPSRLGKYSECPAKVKYEDILKLCPLCKKGKISGGFDGEPVKCDTCYEPQPTREALERGTRLDAALSNELSKANAVAGSKLAEGEENSLDEATRHPEVAALVKKLKRAKGVTQQESIVLDSKWNRVSQFTKGAWGRLKLDVLHLTGKIAKIYDWKSGNIDKRTGLIRERSEYADSMLAYQIATLSAYPKMQSAEATMVFIDAPPKLPGPFKSLPVLTRKELPEAQKKWEKKVEKLMSDAIFAPRPGFYCTWCSYANSKGGPCTQG